MTQLALPFEVVSRSRAETLRIAEGVRKRSRSFQLSLRFPKRPYRFLSHQELLRIRAMLAVKNPIEVANEFGLDRSHVYKIKNGRIHRRAA